MMNIGARALCGLAALLVLGLAQGAAVAGEKQRYVEWQGWIVGEPCSAAYRIADCPLRYIERPVLLREDGRTLAFLYGDGSAVSQADVDKAYGKKVRLKGGLEKGVFRPIRMDLLEKSGEKKFFKGCL